jgi:hypothetical protein
MKISVQCYAGHRGEQEPRAFRIDDREVGVSDVQRSWIAPGGRYFGVRGDDGRHYVLRHDEQTGDWHLE